MYRLLLFFGPSMLVALVLYRWELLKAWRKLIARIAGRKQRKAQLMEARRVKQREEAYRQEQERIKQREEAYRQEREELQKFYQDKRARWAELRLDWEVRAQPQPDKGKQPEPEEKEDERIRFAVHGLDMEALRLLAEACPACDTRDRNRINLCQRCSDLPAVNNILNRHGRLT